MELLETEFRNNWIELNVEPNYINWLAINSWKCPKNNNNRQKLSEDDWKNIHNRLVETGSDVKFDKEADLCGTFYGEKGISFLIWLSFTGTDGKKYSLDVYINEKQANGKINCTKRIDPRSPKCVDIYNSIVSQGYIDTNITKLLHSIGSKTWTGSTESKVQKKLNSEVQSTIFEEACKICSVDYRRLDPFDDSLYRGDPGKLADYDLIIDNQKTRVDLKLLENLTKEKFCQQNPHDAQLLIGSNWHTGDSAYHRITDSPSIENTQKFKELLKTFSNLLREVGPVFLHIDKIDINTGKVDFVKFGNKNAF